MKLWHPFPPARRTIELAAAAWVVREERGLTPQEQDELSQWLAADPRHGAALNERRWAWREFDRIAGLPAQLIPAPDPDLLASRSAFAPPPWVTGPWIRGCIAAAAALVLGLVWRADSPTEHRAGPPPSAALAAPCEQQVLADGSLIELNRGARLSVELTPTLRRVRLERGEAHFTVTKDAQRPFVVEASGIAVRAIGTAFNVRLAATEVEVVVAEGKVAVQRDTASKPVRPAASAPPVLLARQRVVVPLGTVSTIPPATTLSEGELATRLAWQPRLLDFSDAPLAEVVAEFNRRNPLRLTLGTASLRNLRVNASIRSDNVEGFVRLLESGFDLRSEWRGETEIVLWLGTAERER